ncbi:dihydrofolate reductase family protein [Shimazuella kribbensis]|uniref:dihydrofolate reductase family protein n=1 Tax=Shimazuella kribbensis TaxID=139808 RepID=UPI0004103697|nr:dihydrofolate reductase family protein [Shimazuella kribbensis]
MNKVIVSLYLSLDGVMEEPAWTAPYFNEQVGKFQHDLLFSSGALLLGRNTYQGMSSAWPSMTDEDGFADRINSIPKFVPTTTLDELEWNADFIKGDLVEEVTKLKQEFGQDLLIYGSSELIRTLMQHDLIDEFHFIVNPIVVGKGKRLFEEGIDTKTLKMINTQTTDTGVVIISYELDKQNS